MNLVASLIVREEMGRYLRECIGSLQEFCDEIRVLDDGSSDGSYEFLEQASIRVKPNTGPSFFKHEGQARQALLEWTLEGNPTHVVAIDSDELIADGRAIRAAIDHDDLCPVWTIEMDEVWKADEQNLWLRRDGGWRPHNAPILYRVPEKRDKNFRIMDRALACGREPMSVRAQFRNSMKTGTQILHFGWTNVAERQERYERYVAHDDGKYHAKRHLDSIMFPDQRVGLVRRDWPVGLLGLKDALLERVNRA